MPTKKRSFDFHRSSLTPRPSFDATALGAHLGATVVNVVQTRTIYADRCHQREVLLEAAITQARVWEAEAVRRHDAFDATLELASKLVEGGHVEQAVEVLSQGARLLPPMEAGPTMLTALVSVGGT